MRTADVATTTRARSLRQADNDAEAALWQELRARRLNGFKFVRQLPIGRYFADFACREARLVVELDGSQHSDNVYDRRRDAEMAALGWSVLRFRNFDVFTARVALLDTLVAALDGMLAAQDTAEMRYVLAADSGGER